jgi:hypothetical protein
MAARPSLFGNRNLLASLPTIYGPAGAIAAGQQGRNIFDTPT